MEGDKRVLQVLLLPKGADLVARLALLHRTQLLNLGDELVVPSAAIFMDDGKV